MNKSLLIAVAVSGMLAVAIGAFAAHGLKPRLSEKEMQWLETASRYHFYHTLAALAALLLQMKIKNRWFEFSCFAFLAGIVFFSGSLYAMAVTEIMLGMITPIGGLLFIAGWVMMAAGAMKSWD